MEFVRRGEFVRSFMHALSSTALRRSPLPEGAFRDAEDVVPYKSTKTADL